MDKNEYYEQITYYSKTPSVHWVHSSVQSSHRVIWFVKRQTKDDLMLFFTNSSSLSLAYVKAARSERVLWKGAG